MWEAVRQGRHCSDGALVFAQQLEAAGMVLAIRETVSPALRWSSQAFHDGLCENEKSNDCKVFAKPLAAD